MSMFQRGAGMFNTLLRPVLGAPVVGKFLSGSLAEVTYVGRKSGRRVELLVAYKRRGDEVLIAVAMPDKAARSASCWTVSCDPDARSPTRTASVSP